jgi:protein-S-isoprenylcysteine O-methyltransferase Ste14
MLERETFAEVDARSVAPALKLVRPAGKPSWRDRLRPNLLPATVWGFLFYMQLLRFDFPPALPNLLIALINVICVVLFIFRSEPTKTGTPAEMVLAVSGTFVVAFMPEAAHVTFVSASVQVAGLLAWAASLAALGSSLGIAPADRGLKVRGPYALVRHPVYASELVFWIGFGLSSPTLLTGFILAVWWCLQMLRIWREERLIEGYDEYRSRVRWRVVPGLW